MRKISSLKTRLILVATVSVAGISGAMLATVAYVAHLEVDKAVRTSAGRAQSALSVIVRKQQEAQTQLVELVADLPVVRSVTETHDPATIALAAEHYHTLIDTGWIIITDDEGKFMAASSPSGEKVTEWKASPSVLAAAKGSVSSGVIRIGNELAMSASAPVYVGDYIRGSMTIGLPIDDTLAQDIAKTATTNIAFILDGRVVGSSLKLDSVDPEALLHGKSVSIDHRSFAASTSDPPKSWYDSGLKVVSLSDTATIEMPFKAISRVLGIIFGVSLIMALAFGYGMATRLTEPLHSLVAAARKLNDGQWPEPVTEYRNDEVGLLQTVFDEMVVSLRASQEELLEMVQVDPLTRLANHNTFRDRLASAVLAAQTASRPLALVILDLDNFEEFNLKNGRDAGDLALITVADILRSRFADSAAISRFAGNQFATVLGDETAQEVFEAVELVLEEIWARTGCTASAGVAESGVATQRPDLLILAADLAVQQAKLAGKNRCRVYDGDITASSVEDLKAFLQGGSYAAVRALAEAVDAKDRYTRGHSQRVAEYARDLARAAGYEDGFVELVFTTGTLHDVGKIGVPDSVLHKTGRLTEEEFDAVKAHPVLGEKIVGQIAALQETLPGIRHHHERYDGRGYPDGLAGENIPLIARILAVADTYDAMTSDRPYRTGMPVDVALEEIARNAGVQFDPRLAELFVEMRTVRRAA